jgi:hypothetical protein
MRTRYPTAAVKNAESAEGVFAENSPDELKPTVALGVAVEVLGFTATVVDADTDGETEDAIDEVEAKMGKAVEVGRVPEADDEVLTVFVMPAAEVAGADVDEALEVLHEVSTVEVVAAVPEVVTGDVAAPVVVVVPAGQLF